MTDQAFFLDIAKIAITFIGFTSVVVAVRHPGAEVWAPREVAGALFMIEHAMAAMLIGLVPFPLTQVFSEANTWRICSGLLALFLVTELLVQRRRRAQVTKQDSAPTHPRLLVYTYFLPAIAVSVFLVVNVRLGRPIAVMAASILLLYWCSMQFWVFIGGTRIGKTA